MVDAEFIEYEERDGAALLTIDRPEKLNALTDRAFDELLAALETAEEAPVRAVVLRGTEEAFSVGYDVGNGGADERELSVQAWLERMRAPLIPAIFDLHLPVIAAVDGYALGGGFNIALACDLTFATERAQFGYSDLRMGGLPAHFVHPFVMGSIKHARELYYSGKMIDGTEAERMGLVNRAVPRDDLMHVVWEEVAEIRKVPGVIVTLAKSMLNDAMERRGFRPHGRGSELLATLSVLTEPAREFYERRDREGMDAAIEWMHSVDKA